MKQFILMYVIGLHVVESYQFGNKNQAMAKRWELMTSGRYNQGSFKIVER